MPRRLLDRCLPDSVREFRAAAFQRSQDAHSLAAAGRRTAAIYLWGYAAEMTLKAAYFSALGFPETRPITMGDLRGAVTAALGLGVAWPGQNLHDLRAWAEFLVAFRASRLGLAYRIPGFGNQVIVRGQRLQRVWRETLRYHKNVAYPHEVSQVRDSADWLLKHSLSL